MVRDTPPDGRTDLKVRQIENARQQNVLFASETWCLDHCFDAPENLYFPSISTASKQCAVSAVTEGTAWCREVSRTLIALTGGPNQ